MTQSLKNFAILISALVLFFPEKGFGQETKHSISIGIHQGVYDTYGPSGPLLRMDYNYHLNENIHFSSLIHLGTGRSKEENNSFKQDEFYSSYGIGAQIKYIPFPKLDLLKRIKFQLGVNYNFENEIVNTEYSRDNLPSQEVTTDEINSFKPIIGFEIDLLKTSVMNIGYTGVFNPPTKLQGYHGLVVTFKLKSD